ncbi:hypothetical protein SETIT_7G072300v2, partial [Setaria italica]
RVGGGACGVGWQSGEGTGSRIGGGAGAGRLAGSTLIGRRLACSGRGDAVEEGWWSGGGTGGRVGGSAGAGREASSGERRACDGGDGDDEGNEGRAASKKAPGARHDGSSRSGRGAAVEDPMRKGMTIAAKCWGGRGWDFYRP